MELNPQEVIDELVTFRSKLAILNGEIIKLGNNKAEAEHNYRLAKAKKIIELRHDKTPVTLIGDLAKGDPDIAKLKLELDKFEVLYKNKMQNIASLRDVISVYQSILNWLKVEYNSSNI